MTEKTADAETSGRGAMTKLTLSGRLAKISSAPKIV
jgi:hypothetical protein